MGDRDAGGVIGPAVPAIRPDLPNHVRRIGDWTRPAIIIPVVRRIKAAVRPAHAEGVAQAPGIDLKLATIWAHAQDSPARPHLSGDDPSGGDSERLVGTGV